MSQSWPNQSSLAKQFLSKMDADLSSIRQAHPTTKSNLEEVTSTLTSKRIHPLASTPPPSTTADDTLGTVFGMSWRTLLGLSVSVGLLLFFVFFNYAKQNSAQHHNHTLALQSHLSTNHPPSSHVTTETTANVLNYARTQNRM